MNQVISHTASLSEPTPSRVLTKPELAGALHMSVRSLEGLLKAGDLPAGVRRGRFLFWDANVVCKWHDELFAAQRAWIPS
ncbi:helix-turn-helix transcriptional regulator [Caenimonas terrae]|uniref:Helix-turn-helix transcriptional regulator n=1 Tax=Caenimonas terrae TaxID=696074 RepID=A0ABW0N748_9BURK